MDEMNIVLNTKNVRKAACAAAIGWTVGKFIGGTVNAVYSGIILALIKRSKLTKNDIEEETKE